MTRSATRGRISAFMFTTRKMIIWKSYLTGDMKTFKPMLPKYRECNYISSGLSLNSGICDQIVTGIRNIENEYNAKVNNALFIEMVRYQSQWTNHFRDISHRYVRRIFEHEITVMQISKETIMSTSDKYRHMTHIYRIGTRL